MPSSSADSSGRDARGYVERETAAATPPPEKVLLEQVLQQTVSALGDLGAAGPKCLQALRTVALRHRGEPVTTPAVATELVAAALSCGWPGLTDRGGDELLSEIVESLLEDPPARARLEAVWALLDEAPP